MNIVRAHGLVVPYTCAFALCGCLTIDTVNRATDPHPSFGVIEEVRAAAVVDGSLFLELGVTGTQGHYRKPGSVVVQVKLNKLTFSPNRTRPSDPDPEMNVARPPIHVVESGSIPSGATPVPVLKAALWDLEHLAQLEGGPPLEMFVAVINPIQGGPLDDLCSEDDVMKARKRGPLMAIVVPSKEGVPLASLVWDVDQRPRTRHGWWLLTPFTVAGDIVLSPLYLAYLLGGGC